MRASNDSSRSYITITGDTHGGASIDAYREYLDPPERDAFDAWRGRYKNRASGALPTPTWAISTRQSRQNGPYRT